MGSSRASYPGVGFPDLGTVDFRNRVTVEGHPVMCGLFRASLAFTH